MPWRYLVMFAVWCVGLLAASPPVGAASEWNPQTFAKEETLEVRTVGTEEGEYRFPVWLVVIDEHVYVRLGTRAAERVQKNTTTPFIGVKIAGQQFDQVKAEEAPEMADPVAKAMAGKYWSDLFIRFFPHPLTLRLIPEEKK
jgi:hypothetical protein